MSGPENPDAPAAPSGGGGFELRPAHYPDRAPVDAYGNGGFRFAGMSHRGSLLLLPSGIYAWNIAAAPDLSLEAFAPVFAEADKVEVLLVGTGADIAPLPEAWRAVFRDKVISADAMSTGAAVRTFNVLLAEGRAVSAALIAVD